MKYIQTAVAFILFFAAQTYLHARCWQADSTKSSFLHPDSLTREKRAGFVSTAAAWGKSSDQIKFRVTQLQVGKPPEMWFEVYPKENEVIITRLEYTTIFDTVNLRPTMGIYIFTKKNFNHTYSDDYVNYDKQIDKKYQNPFYKYAPHSDYDKGHIVPKEDFRYSQEAASNVNVYTNIVPQKATVNRGVWKAIENRVRSMGYVYDTVYVFTGCLYDSTYFGQNVSVPSYFWKVIKYKSTYEAYLVSNRNQARSKIQTKKVPLRKIETLTGLKWY